MVYKENNEDAVIISIGGGTIRYDIDGISYSSDELQSVLEPQVERLLLLYKPPLYEPDPVTSRGVYIGENLRGALIESIPSPFVTPYTKGIE